MFQLGLKVALIVLQSGHGGCCEDGGKMDWWMMGGQVMDSLGRWERLEAREEVELVSRADDAMGSPWS